MANAHTKMQTQRVFKTGETIMRQGDPGDCAYIIEGGRVEILIEKTTGESYQVGTRGPGAMIGEMALVDQAPRTATIRALEDCVLLPITQDDFSGRLKNADPILEMATKVILTRYRDTLTRTHIGGLEPSDFVRAEIAEQEYARTSSAVENVKIANDFKDAMNNGQLKLFYQPILDLKTTKINGFEALMRWQHPEKGFISPGVFIPIIEDSGLIVEASQWALKESLMALKRIEGHTGYDNELFMSVNFSSKDFASDDFVEGVYATLSKSDVSPKNVHFEITERLLMGQPEKAKETLEMCRKAGMGISLDDFGTGYSSLSYLHYFPIDTIKIDRSFVSGSTEDENILKLVKSIIDLSKSMNKETIAEGVEDESQAALLAGLGCDMVQGFYFAKPMCEKDVIDYVKTNK